MVGGEGGGRAGRVVGGWGVHAAMPLPEQRAQQLPHSMRAPANPQPQPSLPTPHNPTRHHRAWCCRPQELRGRWQPELERIVDKINTTFGVNFQQIGCAGEVKLDIPEDFDRAAIRIL